MILNLCVRQNLVQTNSSVYPRYGKRKRLRGSVSAIFKEIKATRTSSDCLYFVEMTGF